MSHIPYIYKMSFIPLVTKYHVIWSIFLYVKLLFIFLEERNIFPVKSNHDYIFHGFDRISLSWLFLKMFMVCIQRKKIFRNWLTETPKHSWTSINVLPMATKCFKYFRRVFGEDWLISLASLMVYRVAVPIRCFSICCCARKSNLLELLGGCGKQCHEMSA